MYQPKGEKNSWAPFCRDALKTPLYSLAAAARAVNIYLTHVGKQWHKEISLRMIYC